MTACFWGLIQNLIVKVAKNHEKRTVVPRENQERMAFQPCRKAKRMTNLCKAAILLIYGFLCGYLQTNSYAVVLSQECQILSFGNFFYLQRKRV